SLLKPHNFKVGNTKDCKPRSAANCGLSMARALLLVGEVSIEGLDHLPKVRGINKKKLPATWGNMFARLALRPRLPIMQVRTVACEASELRPGDMIEIKGRVLEVVTREHRRTGARGQAVIQVR
ncbi:hypothetical protein M1146_00210, partial [Patescibacteria group bacterium]|nr:hypothetical protein [Patescibacteria group bacterium]